MRKSIQQVQYDVGKRRLEDPKLKRERLTMDQPQVIFEYGKLHLNLVSAQNQLQQMSGLLAEASKKEAERTQELAGAQKETAEAKAKLDQLLKAIMVHPPLSYEELSKLADEINAPAVSEPTPIDRKK
jgi:hypothetical protein